MGALDKFLKKHKSEAVLTENGKVRCTITGHELPCEVEILEKYWAGKALAKARRAKKQSDFDESEFAPFIVAHTKKPETHVFCKITEKTIDRDTDAVRRHISGRRYKYLLKQLEEKRVRQAKKAEKRAAMLAKRGKDAAEHDDDESFQEEDGDDDEEDDDDDEKDDEENDHVNGMNVAEESDDSSDHGDEGADMEGIKGNNDEDMSNGEMNAIESDSDDDTKFWVRNGKEIQASPKKAVASEKEGKELKRKRSSGPTKKKAKRSTPGKRQK